MTVTSSASTDAAGKRDLQRKARQGNGHGPHIDLATAPMPKRQPQHMGWLIRRDEPVHTGQTQGISELDVEPVWASKVIGVLPPDQTW